MRTLERADARIREGLTAAIPAAVLSGIPSTFYALATGDNPLEASLAAGSILLPRETDRARLLAAAVAVHLGLSALWGVVLAALLPRRRPLLEGALAGAAIAALDLGLVGRRYPRIRSLKPLPQVADHVAFGVIAATVLSRRGKLGG